MTLQNLISEQKKQINLMFRRNSELVVIKGEPYLAYKAGTEIDEILDANITTAITKGYELALEEERKEAVEAEREKTKEWAETAYRRGFGDAKNQAIKVGLTHLHK